MQYEFDQWLRVDHDRAAIIGYFGIDPKDVQEAYLAAMPQLGILTIAKLLTERIA
ncbi:Uncharacterised protein [uncultured archaeon]|nr:Uncharacterised protein [uncultured archaeon]